MMSSGWRLLGDRARAEEFRALAAAHSLAHGYVFYGPEGVGKRSFALALARFVEESVFAPPEARPLSDMMLVAPGENGSIGIDAAREARRFVAAHPAASAYRMLIIDDAEFLTTEAQNALLKTAEEPYPSTLMLLIAADREALLPTLRSRLQEIEFGTVGAQEIAEWLAREHGMNANSAAACAARAFGRPGLAYRMAKDDRFQATLAAAEKFLRAGTPTAGKAIIKALTDNESFNIDQFLEAVMIVASPEAVKRAPSFWHAAVRLREEARRFPLNAKLQLTALLQVLQS